MLKKFAITSDNMEEITRWAMRNSRRMKSNMRDAGRIILDRSAVAVAAPRAPAAANGVFFLSEKREKKDG